MAGAAFRTGGGGGVLRSEAPDTLQDAGEEHFGIAQDLLWDV